MDKDISLKDIYNLINTVNTNLTQKVDNIEKDITDLALRINKEVNDIKSHVDKLKIENAVLRNRLKTTERQIKRNNLVIYGIVEEDDETQENVLESFVVLLNEKLQVNLCTKDFTNCYRLGRKSNRSRPILVTLMSNFHKQLILRQRAQLKGTSVFINEDLTIEDRNERKVLIEALKGARAKNQNASLRGRKLMIDGTWYTSSDINQAKAGRIESGYYTPPPARTIVSEPNTPSQPLIHDDSTEEIDEISQQTHNSQTENQHPKPAQEPQGTNIFNNSDNKRKFEFPPSKLPPNTRKTSSSGYATRSNFNKNTAKQ